ncbi:MAG: hypothetical protein LC104_16605 [Bacteroidales bacterium]|nr:hypothetical protein [Bacteroidales bacterium]
MRTRLIFPVLALIAPMFICAAEPDSDPFAKGTIWAGEARLGKTGKVGKWALSVSERKGLSFQGEIIAQTPEGKIDTIKVTGTATSTESGSIAFKTEKRGFTDITVKGKLRNGEAALIFYGTGKFGGVGAGTATLKRIN